MIDMTADETAGVAEGESAPSLDSGLLCLVMMLHFLHLPADPAQLMHQFGAADSIPLDKWFGTFHDGSPEADEALKKRRIGKQ